jgi:hypothetical protein
MKLNPGSSVLLRAFGWCILAVALVIGLSACGSSSASSGSSSAAGSSVSSSSSRYQARLNLAKCMRAHGVNVPDPPATGGIGANGPGPSAGVLRALQSSPNTQSALQACAQYRSQAFPFASNNSAQRAQFQQELVKFARCMRSHNIDIPDPSTSGSGGFGLQLKIPSSQRNSPAFQSAFQACRSTLPALGRGAPGA